MSKETKKDAGCRSLDALVLFFSDCWYFVSRWLPRVKIDVPTKHQTAFLWRLARRRHKVKAYIFEKQNAPREGSAVARTLDADVGTSESTKGD